MEQIKVHVTAAGRAAEARIDNRSVIIVSRDYGCTLIFKISLTDTKNFLGGVDCITFRMVL